LVGQGLRSAPTGGREQGKDEVLIIIYDL